MLWQRLVGVFVSLWGWAVLVFPRPMFGLWVGLVFWFGLFFWFCWDGASLGAMLDGMGWDGVNIKSDRAKETYYSKDFLIYC